MNFVVNLYCLEEEWKTSNNLYFFSWYHLYKHIIYSIFCSLIPEKKVYEKKKMKKALLVI